MYERTRERARREMREHARRTPPAGGATLTACAVFRPLGKTLHRGCRVLAAAAPVSYFRRRNAYPHEQYIRTHAHVARATRHHRRRRRRQRPRRVPVNYNLSGRANNTYTPRPCKSVNNNNNNNKLLMAGLRGWRRRRGQRKTHKPPSDFPRLMVREMFAPPL